MQFTDDEWRAFAERLARATDAGKLRWDFLEGTWSANAYSASVPGNAVYTLYSRDGDGQFPYVLSISDVDGTSLGEFTTVAYGDEWEQTSAHSASQFIDRLYSRVARLVTGAPQKAQSLLNGLDGLLPPDNDTPF